MMEGKVTTYWQKFMSILPPDLPYRTKNYIAESWGTVPKWRMSLATWIARGIKTATCSALWEWEAEGNGEFRSRARSPLYWMAEETRSASSKRRKSRSVIMMKWMPSLHKPKAKGIFPWPTGGKLIEISFRELCQ